MVELASSPAVQLVSNIFEQESALTLSIATFADILTFLNAWQF